MNPPHGEGDLSVSHPGKLDVRADENFGQMTLIDIPSCPMQIFEVGKLGL